MAKGCSQSRFGSNHSDPKRFVPKRAAVVLRLEGFLTRRLGVSEASKLAPYINVLRRRQMEGKTRSLIRRLNPGVNAAKCFDIPEVLM